jgi:hypothetical protein
MPIFTSPVQSHTTADGFGFSAVKVEHLGAAEYTLALIIADTSGSIWGSEKHVERCIVDVVTACRTSPRVDNLMLRLVTFDTTLSEVHGFRPLVQCNAADYAGCIEPGGGTALFDATANALASATKYGEQLHDAGLECNAIVVVITDGLDTSSRLRARSVGAALRDAVSSEALDGIRSILVGVNVQSATVGRALDGFRKGAGFDQYVEVDRADAATLARLADFIARSISAQSPALGGAMISRSLVF